MGWLYYLQAKEKRLHDDQYKIVAIVQKPGQPDALKTIYLAELLGLSFDKPANLYQFDSREGEKRLVDSFVIKKVAVKKIRPGALYVDYEMRTPAAFLGNAANTAIDKEGFLFPFKPFFTPKTLPEFYLTISPEDCIWGATLKKRRDLKLAFDVFQKIGQTENLNAEIKRIDVSQAFSDSFGQRQIVIVLEEATGNGSASRLIFLRLNAQDYAQNIANYNQWRQREIDQGEWSRKGAVQIIDLRIPHLAFIKQDLRSET